MIYFDNNATTKISDRVLELMTDIYKFPFNSSAAHQFGQIAKQHSNQARTKIANLLNAQNYQIIFTSGATEANNIALRGFENCRIVTSSAEHLSVLNVAKKLGAIIVNVDENSLVKIDELETAIKNLQGQNFMVSVMLANNETGVIQNIKEIARLTHQYGGLIHSDITQAIGKIKIDLENLNVDLASVSAHKINGPQGIGALFVRKPLQIEPLMQGSLQEEGKRPGTSNIAGIVGFGESCKLAGANLEDYQKVSELRDYLESRLQEIAADDVIIFGQDNKRLPNTSFFATKNLDNQTFLISLDLNNIAVSIGSACSSGVTKVSHVLKAMNIDENIAKTVVRVSLCNNNTKEEVDKFIAVWSDLYAKNKKSN